MRFLFCGDIHGNEQQLSAIVRYTWKNKIDVFVFLGDFSPNRFMYECPPKADAFNRDTIFPLFKAINAKYKFVMPGNTDFATNSAIYEHEFTDPRFGFFEYIRHGVRYIDGKLGILFSSYTNISPHSLKDSECVDVERDKVISSEKSSHARLGTRQTTRVIVDYEECPRCGPNCICKVKEDIITTHRDIEQHAKVKYVVAESLAVKGVISKEPDPNELSDDPTVEPIMLSDALAYSKKYFEVVDVMDPRTQPEWYRVQQQTTICTKMKATLLSLCGLYDKVGYMQGLNLPLEQIPEANNVRFVTNDRIEKFDVVSWHNECCAELVGRSFADDDTFAWTASKDVSGAKVYMPSYLRRRMPPPVVLWATHGPTFNTTADRLRSGDHCGSKGYRNILNLLPYEYMPDIQISGHIHEATRDGTFSSSEAFPKECGEKMVEFTSIGNEGLVVPFCLNVAFILMDFDDNGKLLDYQRVVIPVQPYRDSEEAVRRFRASLSKVTNIKKGDRS